MMDNAKRNKNNETDQENAVLEMLILYTSIKVPFSSTFVMSSHPQEPRVGRPTDTCSRQQCNRTNETGNGVPSPRLGVLNHIPVTFPFKSQSSSTSLSMIPRRMRM